MEHGISAGANRHYAENDGNNSSITLEYAFNVQDNSRNVMRSPRSMRNVVVKKLSAKEVARGMIADDLRMMFTNLRTTLCLAQTNAPEVTAELEAIRTRLSALRLRLTSETKDDAGMAPFPGVQPEV